MLLHSVEDVGHDFLVAEAFEAPILPEWRLAYFSLVLPIPSAAGLASDGRPFDFATVDGWNYGRDKGIRTIENPQWDEARQVFCKPLPREGYYGDLIVEGGRPRYNDARERFVDPLDAAMGAASVDVDIARSSPAAARQRRETFSHDDLAKVRAENQARRCAKQRWTSEVPLAEAGWDERIFAHHFNFTPLRNETFFELVNYDQQLPWEDQIRGERNSHGPATLRLMSAEVMQFHDLNLTNLDGAVPEPAKINSDFLILNVAAENISSATLAFLSATLSRPRNSSQFYAHDGDYDASPPQLYALPKFVNLAVEQIDAALGRPGPSMRISAGGWLVANQHSTGTAGTFTLPPPQRVALAIPNPARPDDVEKLAQTRSEGNNGSVPSNIAGPLTLQSQSCQWSWDEQWAWQILTGADSYPEQVPQQSQAALAELVAATLSSWTIMTSAGGVSLVRKKSASREGMRYWSMANTRFVDIVMLQMRAQAGEGHLRKSLQIVGEHSTAGRGASDEKSQRADLQADLERLEMLQLDHIEIRDKLWFRSVPGRDIDTRVLKGLQRATGFDQLREDFDSKVQSRQDVIRTQFEQLSGVIAEQDAKRSEATNLVLGFVAAAIGAPDWAAAMGHDTVAGTLLWGLVIFCTMFLAVGVIQAVFRLWRRNG